MELFEREAALDELNRWLDQAAAGEGCLVLLGGEAGGGKTVLVRWFCQEVASRARVLVGACDALSTPRPLGPLLDIAAEIGGEIDRLLQAEARREQVFGACLREFSGAWRPVVVVFEDVHWADEATLDLLRFLGRRTGACRAVLIATYRDDELGPKHPLRAVFGDLATAAAVHRLSLAPLSVDAVRRMAMGRDFDPETLHQRTGGNPFYVTEVLAAGGNIPTSVRDAVLTRVARLSPAGRATLDLAAVAGTPVDTTLLSRLAPSLDAIDECLAAGMLRIEGRMLAFRHELAREAMLGALSPPRMATLHAQVLRALTSAPIGPHLFGRLAHHAEGAADGAAVLRYAPAAAQCAAELFAHREAAAHYARALRFAGHLSDEEREPLLHGWFSESYSTGQLADAIEAQQTLLAIAQQSGNREKEARNFALLAAALVLAGRNAEAEQASRESLATLEGLPLGSVHAIAYRLQSYLRMLNRDNAEAVVWGERAMAAAERVGDVESLINAANSVGSARLLMGDETRGRADLERSRALAEAAGHDRFVAAALTNLGSAYGEIYRFALAERYLQEGIAYATERDLDGVGMYMVAWLALTRLYQGDWTKAADLAAAVLRHPSPMAISRVMALVAVGRVRARRGDPEVWAALDEALALAEPTGTLQRIAPVRAARAEAAWLAGDRERSATEARAAYDLAVRHQHAWHIGELSFWLWRCGEIAAAPPGAADPFARQIAGDWPGAATAWATLDCPYEEARALADTSDEEPLRRALATFERLGARPMAAIVARHLRHLGARAIPRGPRPATRANPANLTAREAEILRLIGDNLRNAEIAKRLFLSPKTVEHHVSAIFAKLGVTSRADATREAGRLDLIAQSGGSDTPT